MAKKKPNKATGRCGMPKKAKKNKASARRSKWIRNMRNAGWSKTAINLLFEDEDRQSSLRNKLAKSMQRNVK